MTNQTEALYQDDLEINRDGHLSERQKKGLQLSIFLWYGIAGVDVFFLIFIIYFQLRYQFGNLGYLLLCGLSILSTRYCLSNASPYREDIKNDKVITVSGQVFKRSAHIKITKGSYLGLCIIRVNNRVFTISPYFYDYMIDKEFYRLYFAPKTKRIMNIEEL